MQEIDKTQEQNCVGLTVQREARCTNELLSNDGFCEFQIKLFGDFEYAMEFEVYEVVSWEADDSNTPCDTELYIKGTIKWDGCSHLNFGDEGYLHLCGKSYFVKHCKVITALYELAEKTIKQYDADVAA